MMVLYITVKTSRTYLLINNNIKASCRIAVMVLGMYISKFRVINCTEQRVHLLMG